MSAFRKLRDHLQHQVLGGLATLAATEINDVYALAFLVDNQDDDPRCPVLTVRHNTRAQVRIALRSADSSADGNPAAIGLLALEIESCFNEECVRLARALHSTGTLEGALGRPVPILIPEWEHGSGTAGQTLAANPAGLAREYIDWTRGAGPLSGLL